MSKSFDYTAYAQRFSAKYPVMSYVGTQINFWVAANILLGIILHLNVLSLNATFKIGIVTSWWPNIIIGKICGC